MNVLFSSVGRRVELVRAFRESFARRGRPVKLVGTDVDWMAPALQEVDAACLVPRCDAPGYAAAVAAICRDHEVDLLLPLIDPEIPVLAAHRAALEAAGTQLAVVPEAAAQIAADKWTASQFFQRLDLPSPQSWLPEQAQAISEEDFPVFIKPRCGSAAADTFKVRNRDELNFFIRYVPNPIIQEFLDGPEITTDVICQLDGHPQAIVSRQRIAVRGGEAIKSVTIPNDPVRRACLLVARELPAIGPITVQCMLQNGVPHFIEINARLGGGLPLAVAAGVDVPALIGQNVERDPDGPRGQLCAYQPGVYMTRCDESFFIEESFRGKIESHHLRS